jgi:hypothetical protein
MGRDRRQKIYQKSGFQIVPASRSVIYIVQTKRVSVTSLFYGDEVQLLFSTRRNSLLWN